ncbi:MAG: hypothetical protein U0359_38090 [Byssovorax sp.]
MAQDRSPQAVLDELAAHPRGDDLARLVHTLAFAAADERRDRLADGLAEVVERFGLAGKDADTTFGNVIRALERGTAETAGSATRVLLAALLARGVALSPPSGADAEARVAESLVWLATHTAIDALSALDAALGDEAEGLWLAVGALIRKVEAGNAPLVGRAGAVIAAVALRESTSEAARGEARALATGARDPLLRALLGDAAEPKPAAPERTPGGAATLTGELVSPPRGPIALLLLGVTGLLVVFHAARFVARAALRYRRPAELTINAKGLLLRSKTELLGRTLREEETRIPIEALLSATREIRYPRAGLYAGLVSLALGSYLGVSFLVDGARAGSPELIGIGALLLGAGVALDYVFENVLTGQKGRCRVVIAPRKGPRRALGDLDPVRADAALERLARAAK